MATSEQNKQTVARVFDAFRAGDVDAFDELIVEDYVQHNPQADNGLQAVKDFFAPLGPVDVRHASDTKPVTRNLNMGQIRVGSDRFRHSETYVST